MPGRWGYPYPRTRAGLVELAPREEPWAALAWLGQRFTGQGAQAGVAAESQNVQLFLPNASVFELLVEDIFWSVGTAETVVIGWNTTALGTLDNEGQSLDGPHGASPAQVRVFSGAEPTLTRLSIRRVLANVDGFWTRMGHVMRPGQGLVVQGATQNISIAATFHFRARPRVYAQD